MIDVRKSIATGGSQLAQIISRQTIAKRGIAKQEIAKRVAALGFEKIGLDQVRRWLPLVAVLAVAGCSWFSDESTPATPTPPPSGSAQAKPPEPGEGEAMGTKPSSPEAGGTQTAEAPAAGEPKMPDINSVPNEAPKPSIVNLDQTQQGLGSDTANAQHTDQTLTMPNETAERPTAPAPVAQTAENQSPSVEPTAPETPASPPAVAPEAQTPTAPAPAEAAPAAQPAPVEQVATAGTPEPGAKPFEPNGPLNLAPGSLSRNSQEAAASGTNLASAGAISATPLQGGNSSGVSVDYSVLNGLQSGPSGGYPPAAPMVGSTSAQVANGMVAGVGQAVGYVYFGNGSAGLSDSDRDVLRQVVQLQRIQGGVLRIIGHASQRTGNLDALAQDQVNRKVSLERATAVARALVNMGVQPILVQVAAAGDNQTLYAESTPAGEAGNRRAEVYLSAN